MPIWQSMVESLNICEIAPQVVDQCHWIIRQDLSTDLAISNSRKRKHPHTLLIHQQHLNVQDRLGNGDKLYPYPPETTIRKHHIHQQCKCSKLGRSVSTRKPTSSNIATRQTGKLRRSVSPPSNLSKCCRAPSLAKYFAAGHQQSSDAQQSNRFQH